MDQNKKIKAKEDTLRDILRGYGKIAVAFSGGVDSTYLLKIAAEVLGVNTIAITVKSSSVSSREFEEAIETASSMGVRHLIHEVDDLNIEGFTRNTPDRCYICKSAIFRGIKTLAAQNGCEIVVDGSNFDDLGDYRPGMKALEELKIKSPLIEAGLAKSEIRELSQAAGLSTWKKPALACLATRIPFGEEITREKLRMIDEAENYLRDSGFVQVRVRHHGDIARIEVAAEERIKFMEMKDMNVLFIDEVSRKLKNIGFKYVALDLEGYRTGSMNEILNK